MVEFASAKSKQLENRDNSGNGLFDCCLDSTMKRVQTTRLLEGRVKARSYDVTFIIYRPAASGIRRNISWSDDISRGL